jgi:nitrite reductase (NADH) large subunit
VRSQNKRIVIIGNGGAGLSAIRAIRSVDQSSFITLISSEDCYAYSPVATTYYIAGKITREQLFLTDESFYKKHNVQILLKKKVLEIVPGRALVVIEGNRERIPYDELLVATGATPVLPAGSRNIPTFSLRTLEDAERILSSLTFSTDAVILGGGLVALQLAQTLRKRGIEITVVVASDHILSRNVDEETSLLVQREMENQGISCHFGAEALSIERGRGKMRVQLSTGTILSASLILSGKGVKPNLLQGPLTTNGDMAVDDHMRTRVENIYAAGDVSLVRHLISGQREHLANWPNACYQGWIAGLNMVGGDARLEGLLNQNVTHLFGLRMASIGIFKPPFEEGTEVHEWSDETQKIYRKFFLQQGRMIGAVLVNGIEDIGLIRSLIVRQIDVSKNNLRTANLLSFPSFPGAARRW